MPQIKTTYLHRVTGRDIYTNDVAIEISNTLKTIPAPRTVYAAASLVVGLDLVEHMAEVNRIAQTDIGFFPPNVRAFAKQIIVLLKPIMGEGFDVYEIIENEIERFVESLPSGAGFDCEWEHKETLRNGKEIFETHFHNMNDNGYYDGFTKIRIAVDLFDTEAQVRMTLAGKAKYTDSDYRDMYAETILHTIEA